jgi:diguanylate cyclase (GGDEF)-like protein
LERSPILGSVGFGRPQYYGFVTDDRRAASKWLRRPETHFEESLDIDVNGSPIILVVDDNATNRRILVKSLEKVGYDMREATDGFEAVDLAVAHPPDLILLDIMMPERDGFEVCRILKAQDTTATVPIIFLTAKSNANDVERAFSSGGCDYVLKPFRMHEVKARVSVHLQLRMAQREADERNKQLEKLSRIVAETNIELAREVRTDSLTKLLTRGAWEESATLEHERCERSGSSYGIVMIDVDHFKAFNDTQGHQAGDDCLARVAACIRLACRTSDVVGRYGGEEFVILAADTNGEEVLALAERIREAVYDLNIPHPASSVADRVTISLGIAFRDDGLWGNVLEKADRALYAAKANGRNRVRTAAGPETDSQECSTEDEDPFESEQTIACAPGQQINVLIVNDDATNRMVWRRSLENAGHSIRESNDGCDALEEIAREQPHVILMDTVMPGMDGLECVRRLKSVAETRDIPVIVVSSCADASDVQAGLDAGADEILTKPIRPAELALRVRSMAEKRRDRLDVLRGLAIRGEHSRILNILLDLCRTLGATEDLDPALEQVVSAAAALTGCRRISIMLPDADRNFLTVADSIGIDHAAASAARIPTRSSIAGRVLETGFPVVTNDKTEIGDDLDAFERSFFSSAPILCTALGSAELTVGVLNATGRVGGRPFDPQELECVEMIAGIAGSAIQSILTRRARDEARDAIIVAFARLAEHRDNDTRKHVDRVTQYCLILARDLRKSAEFKSTIDDAFMYDLERSVPLHDIGKIAVPDSILLKPGRLTTEEMSIMRTHAQIGADTIQVVRSRAPDFTMLEMAEEIASAHHEWYDGTGYPNRLRGDDIPLSARIVAVADVYDAVTTKRPYKEALDHEIAVDIILKSTGSQFDPQIVDAFTRHANDFRTLGKDLADPSENHPVKTSCGKENTDQASSVGELETAQPL